AGVAGVADRRFGGWLLPALTPPPPRPPARLTRARRGARQPAPRSARSARSAGPEQGLEQRPRGRDVEGEDEPRIARGRGQHALGSVARLARTHSATATAITTAAATTRSARE